MFQEIWNNRIGVLVPGKNCAMNISEPIPVGLQRELEKRARQLAQPPAESERVGDSLELVSFDLAQEKYAIPSQYVREIQPLNVHHWSPVPCTPGFIIGAISLRGRIYSIMDIARLLGNPDRPQTHEAHILLVRGGRMEDGKEMELTLLTDSVPVIVQISANTLKPPQLSLSLKAHDYIQGITVDLILLNLVKILSDPQIIVFDEI
jgi:purine-binding chemotaxis protein CheW